MSKYSKRFKLKINSKVVKKTAKLCKERGIKIPTFKQQVNPNLVPGNVKKQLKKVGLWDVNPLNLYRITWKNEPKEKGGLFGDVNYVELPQELTGVKARIIGLVGKYFPTGAHKVGAAFGCLAPRLVTGNFDPELQKAVWPSTGNYCRGGSYDCALLGCQAIAILPEEMSKERFEWLQSIGTDEVIATPGCESNVKEIYDKCWELRNTRGDDIVIFNQFDEFGNHLWHYYVTGQSIEETLKKVMKKKDNFAGYVSATGSAGTIAAGDYLKEKFPYSKIIASEALQCPTLLLNGFGGHRIEGIGDKHVPWIHNARNTDFISAIDDEATMCLLRLFNEPAGHKVLSSYGIKPELIKKLHLLGISSICNVLSAIKFAKYNELTENDVIVTIFTDSADMYKSRVIELANEKGKYSQLQAHKDYQRYLLGENINHLKELNYYDRKAIHNLKYFTWVEQQGKTYEEILELWDPEFWDELHQQVPIWDKYISQFNKLIK